MSLTGLKDVDREILKYIDDTELLRVCSINKKTWNDVCDDFFIIRRLSKYSEIEKYKKEDETWKHFYITVIYYSSLIFKQCKHKYIGGDFRKIYRDFSIDYALKIGPSICLTDDESEMCQSYYEYSDVVKYLRENDIHDNKYTAINFFKEKRHQRTLNYLIEN